MATVASGSVPARTLLVENAKMVAIYAFGVALSALASPTLAVIYFGYCILSLLLFVTLICPYCFRYRLGTCLSGYHLFARVFQPRDVAGFARQFKRYLAVLFPVWFVPPLAGLYSLASDFSWWTCALLVCFCFFAFVILPRFSKVHACAACENAPYCPWKNGKVD